MRPPAPSTDNHEYIRLAVRASSLISFSKTSLTMFVINYSRGDGTPFLILSSLDRVSSSRVVSRLVTVGGALDLDSLPITS